MAELEMAIAAGQLADRLLAQWRNGQAPTVEQMAELHGLIQRTAGLFAQIEAQAH